MSTYFSAEERRRWDEAAISVTPKLQAFYDGLAPDERSVLSAALDQSGGLDTDGYGVKQDPQTKVNKLPIWGGLQALVAAIAQPVNPNSVGGGSAPRPK